MRISIPTAEKRCVVTLTGSIQIAGMENRTQKTLPRLSGVDENEPTLSELIRDPVLHAVMARDGIDCADLGGAIDVARARLGLGPSGYCCAC